MEILSTPKAPTAAERKLLGANAAIWAATRVRVESGEPFTFARHRYELEPMCLDHPRVSFRKATQGGFTLLVMLRMIFAMITGRVKQGVIYLFPTDTKVGEFSQLRWTPLIDNNPGAIGRYVRRTNNIHNKRIARASLMMRGAMLSRSVEGLEKESVELRGDPADVIVFDEKDLMSRNAIAKARGRLGHSDLKWEWSLSNPTIPNYGIDADWQLSDQRHWGLRCEACNHWNFLEIEYPHCLRRLADGRVIRACVRCGAELRLDGHGEWVPKHPDRSSKHVGYWWSQLQSHFVDPGTILAEMEDPPEGNLGDVKRLRLGLPHLDAQYGLTAEDVLLACTGDPPASASTTPTVIGVDVGRRLHVVIGVRLAPDVYRILTCLVLEDFEALKTVAKVFHAEVTSIDNEPDLHAARRYQAEGPGQVWLSKYIESVG
ncbi:MAG TPA: phage terminase large subunit family protein, partial [Phycisphaerae bacterium]|nr:phage terminase large subunit family protein [Phycisphaerae bacterium]